MAFCGNCGASLTQATGFCGICGKPVGTPTPTNVTQPSAPQASAAAPGWTPIASQSSPGPSAVSSGGWSPAPNQPQPSANWTPTPAAPAGTSQPSSQGWSSPAVAAPVAGRGEGTARGAAEQGRPQAARWLVRVHPLRVLQHILPVVLVGRGQGLSRPRGAAASVSLARGQPRPGQG